MAGLTGILLLVMGAGAFTPGQETARQLVREVIQNEIRAQTDNHNLWSYRDLSEHNGKKLLFAYCETREGTIHRLLAVNGHPLSPRQQQAEDERIEKLVRSPAAVLEAQKKESSDAEEEQKCLKLFPDAFVYREEDRHGDLMQLAFSPDPGFQASGFLAHALHALQGTMVVNVKDKRLVSLDGCLTNGVKFWGGLLGYLDAGGTFSVSQQKVAPGDWELSSLIVQMTGKALLFKTIGVQQHDSYSNYTPIPPNFTLAQAAERLQKDSEI